MEIKSATISLKKWNECDGWRLVGLSNFDNILMSWSSSYTHKSQWLSFGQYTAKMHAVCITSRKILAKFTRAQYFVQILDSNEGIHAGKSTCSLRERIRVWFRLEWIGLSGMLKCITATLQFQNKFQMTS